MADITPIPGTQPFGIGDINPAANAPVGETAWQLSEERAQREKAAKASDYIGSIWRQDGLVDGLVASLAGSEMQPEQGYFAGTDPQFKDLSKGLWPEYQNKLYEAVSPAHALYLKDRLIQKQEDLVRLGDMGLGGNAGRLAMGVFSPDALLMSMAGGWVTKGVLAAQTVRATKLGQAAMAAERLARMSKAPAVVGGVAFGAAENAAYEALRQSVNFEDDSAATLEAGLVGAALTTPFALAGARASRKVAQAASREREVLAAMKKVEDGAELTPAEARTLKETHEVHTAIREMEDGLIDQDAFEARLEAFHGPVEPDDVWLKRFEGQLRTDTQAMIDELFPNRDAPKVKATPPAPPSEMPASQAEIAAANARNPKLEGPAAVFRTALAARGEARKARDLEALDAEKKRQLDEAFGLAEKDRQARIASDQEAMIRQRELARMAGEEDPFTPPQAPAEAPIDPATAPQASPLGEGSPATPEAAVAAPEPAPLVAAPRGADGFVGKDVSWADPVTGETIEGRALRVSPNGKLVVETDMGELKAVAHTSVDQFDGMSEAPEGFLAGSVGAAQLSAIVNIASQRTAMSKARMDYFAILNRSEHEGVRDLVFLLAKDAIQVDKKQAQTMTASEHKKLVTRQVGGLFHVAVNEAFREAVAAAKVPVLQRGQFKTDFMELVTRSTREGGAQVLAANPTIAPMLTKASTAMKETYAKLLHEAQVSGVKGAQNVAPNDLYVNRMWDHGRIREMEMLHGTDKLVELIANAIKVPGLTGDLVKASRFLTVIKKLEYSPALQSVHLQGRDMGTLRGELQAHGMAASDIDDLVDFMFDARAASGGDAGQAGNLKFRFDLDESMTVKTQAGELRLDQLFENDARVLMDTYLNSMGGHIGLAKVGITSQADWAARIKEITDNAATMPGQDGQRLGKEIGYLTDIHNHITGRPMNTDSFSRSARFMQAFRGYTRSVMLGQLGLTAAFEMNRAVGMLGFKAVWQSVPSFRNFVTALRQGHSPEPGLARDVMQMTGFGTEMASAYARAQELEGGFVGGALSRVERGANAVSHFSDVVSGNASFTSLTRQITGMAAAKDAFQYATGAKKLSAKMRERWVGQGVDDADIDSMLYDLKQYSTGNSGVLETIDYETWSQQAPGSYERFRTFMTRQVRDAIQDQDIGETMPFMHSTIGKMFGELRTFMLVAHAKNFLKNLEYRDSAALQMWMVSFVAESLAYSMQASINFPNELDEKLQPDAIARAALFRMSANGLMPLLTETAYNFTTGGDSLVQPGATANTDSRVLWKTPSYIVGSRLWAGGQTAVGAVLGTDTVTSREFNDAFRALPMTRLYGLPALGNYLSESFDKTDPEKSAR